MTKTTIDLARALALGGLASFSLMADSFVDDTQAEFDGGGYSNTQFDAGNGWLELAPLGQTNGAGSYTSSVKVAGNRGDWESISWTPQRPFDKELPTNSATEFGYPTGNVSMAGNVLLMRMNESSGPISDLSGNGHDGAASGPAYGAAGRFNTALGFDGIDDRVTVPSDPMFDFTNFSVEAWVKIPSNGMSNPYGTDNSVILSRHDPSAGGSGFEFGIDSAARVYFTQENFASNTWLKYDNATPGASNEESTNGRIPLGTNGKGDDYYTFSSSVIKDDGVYKMWYSGYDGTRWRIYHATSADALTWTKYTNAIPADSDTTSTHGRIPLGTAGAGDSTGAYYPAVIKDGGAFKMWYVGYDATNYRVYHATSPDGLAWTKYNNSTPTNSDTTSTDGRIPVGLAGSGDDGLGILGCAVIKDESTYEMWYSGHDGSTFRIYHATSPDGLAWTKTTNGVPAPSDTNSTGGRIPVGAAGLGDKSHVRSCAVIKDGDVYRMWYGGYDGSAYRVYYASSSNGLDWVKFDNSLPSPPRSDSRSSGQRVAIGNSNTGDDGHAYYPSVLKDGSTYRMWYAGYDGGRFRIYSATMPTGGPESSFGRKLDNTVPGASDSVSPDGRMTAGSPDRGDARNATHAGVIKDGATYKMWYQGSDGVRNRIYHATSTNGTVWTKSNNGIPADSDTTSTDGRIPLGLAGSGDDAHTVHGRGIIKDGGIYKMWYAGHDGGTYRIYHATSTNGIDWTKYDNTAAVRSDTTSSNGHIPLGTIGQGDSGQVYAPYVLLDGATYRMWYAGHDGTNYRIYYATSPDGLAWTKYDNSVPTTSDTVTVNGTIPLGSAGTGDEVDVNLPTVIKDGATYRMWYSGSDGSAYRIYYATSTNCLEWTKLNNAIPADSDAGSTDGRVPRGTAGKIDSLHASGASVIKDGSTYKMWYSGSDGARSFTTYATSADGLTWTKYNNDLPDATDGVVTRGRLALGTDGMGDDRHATYCSIVHDGSMYKMWYSGHDGTFYRIYHATSPDGYTWTKYNNATPADSDTTGTDGRVPLGTAGQGDDANVSSPVVIIDGSTYKMWYAGYDGTFARIYHATSSDGGLTWTKQNNDIPLNSSTNSTDGRIPLGSSGAGDDRHASMPSVIKEGGVYRMWYSGHDGANYRVYHATSTNGLDWLKYDNAAPTNSDTATVNGTIPLGTTGTGDDGGIYHSMVVKNGAGYEMWYGGFDGSIFRIYRATSSDGLSWIKANNAVPDNRDTLIVDSRIPRGNTSARGDFTHALRPVVLKEGARTRMWYAGYDATVYRIYYADIYGESSPISSGWSHVAGVKNEASIHLYVDGVETAVADYDTTLSVSNNADLLIGSGLDGCIDELAVYNRALSAEEVADRYKRGGLRLRYQVRSGAANPPTGPFIGPDGTAASYYSELANTNTTTPLLSLHNLDNNAFFQYKAFFETDDPSSSPELTSFTIDYIRLATGTMLLFR